MGLHVGVLLAVAEDDASRTPAINRIESTRRSCGSCRRDLLHEARQPSKTRSLDAIREHQDHP
jgi:hypothetical protein